AFEKRPASRSKNQTCPGLSGHSQASRYFCGTWWWPIRHPQRWDLAIELHSRFSFAIERSHLSMGTERTKIRRMPQQRRSLDPAKLNERFGLHFQGLIVAAGITVGDLQEQMAQAGHKISKQGI